MKRILSTVGIAAGLVAMAGAAAAAPVNLIRNGDFEQTTLSSSGPLRLANLTDWFYDAYNDNDPRNTDYNALYFSAYDAMYVGSPLPSAPWNGPVWKLHQATDSPTGGKFVAIDGDNDYRGSIYQWVNTTAGHTYELTFNYAGAQDTARSGATTETWRVATGTPWDGYTNYTAPTLYNENHGFTGWYTTTMRFVASAAQQMISFLAVGTPDGLPPVSLLDGVRLFDVTPEPPPVDPPPVDPPPVDPPPVDPPPADLPEPASFALLAIGLGALGMTRRTRRRADASAV